MTEQDLRNALHKRLEQLRPKAIGFMQEYMKAYEKGFMDCLELLFKGEETKQETLSILSKQIKDCGLSIHATNICLANGLNTVADLIKITSADWLKFRNGGYKSLKEVEVFLKDNGLHLGMGI